MVTNIPIVPLALLILINICALDTTCCRTRRNTHTDCNQYPLTECVTNDHPDCYWQSDCEVEEHFEFDDPMFGDPIFVGMVPDGTGVERRGPDITTNKLKFPPIDLHPVDFVTSKSFIVVGSDRVMTELPLQLEGFPWLPQDPKTETIDIPALFKLPTDAKLKDSPLYHELLEPHAKPDISHEDIIGLQHKQIEWIKQQKHKTAKTLHRLLNSASPNVSYPNRRRLTITDIPYNDANGNRQSTDCFIDHTAAATPAAAAPLLPPVVPIPPPPVAGAAAPPPNYPYDATGLLVTTYHGGSWGYCTASVIRRTASWIWLLTAGHCVYDNQRRRADRVLGRTARVAIEFEYWHKINDPNQISPWLVQLPSHHAQNVNIGWIRYEMYSEHGGGTDRYRYDSDFAVVKLRNNPASASVNRAVPQGEQLLLAYNRRGPGGHPLRTAAAGGGGAPANSLMMLTYYVPGDARSNNLTPAQRIASFNYASHQCEPGSVRMRQINPIPQPTSTNHISYYPFNGEFGTGGMSGTSTVHVGHEQHVYGVYVGCHRGNDHINRMTHEKYQIIMGFTHSPDPNRGLATRATSGISGPNAKVSIKNSYDPHSDDRMSMEDSYYYYKSIDPRSTYYHATNIIGNITTFVLGMDLMLMLMVGIGMILFMCFVMGFISLWMHSKMIKRNDIV